MMQGYEQVTVLEQRDPDDNLPAQNHLSRCVRHHCFTSVYGKGEERGGVGR